MTIQHLRSSTANKRPLPGSMSDGQIAVNTNTSSPGLFFKDSAGALIKVGPTHVGTTAPNASPASGGETGNSVGEQWLDTTDGTYVFKVWDGSAWRSETGTFVDVNGDVMTGALGIIAGSASAPGLYFSGDTNTGIYSPGADQVAISTNGTRRLIITSDGKVGLGSASVLQQGSGIDGGFGAGILELYNGATGNTTLENTGAFPIIFKTNGSERMRLDSSGRLGLGTSSPSSKLYVLGDASNYGITTEAPSGYGSLTFKQTSGNSISVGLLSNNLFVYDNAAGSTRLTLDSSGRVGIGATTVNTTLEVRNSSTPIIRVGDGTRHMELRGGSTTQNAAVGTNYGGGFDIIQNGSAAVTIDASKRVLVGTSTARSDFFNGSTFSSNVQVEKTSNAAASYIDYSAVRNTNDNEAPFIVLGKSRGATNGAVTVVSADDYLGSISFQGADGAQLCEAVRISAYVDGTPGTDDMPGRLAFSTTADGESSPTERMRINKDGNVFINASSLGTNAYYFAYSPGNGFGDYGHVDGTASGVSYIRFLFNGGLIGSITQSGTTAVAYNTSSDYRLKENVTAVTDGITRLQQLKPSRFNFIADPSKTVDGFIAHEVQAVVPEAITGAKDEVDADGRPVYQGIDQSKLVPLLTAALQEAVAKIESLEARLTAAGI